MNRSLVLRMTACVLSLAPLVGVEVGCVASDETPAEKVGATQAQITFTVIPPAPPVPAFAGPGGSNSCAGTPAPFTAYAESYVAFPVRDGTAAGGVAPVDPYATAYSHGYAWNECGTGDGNQAACTLATSLFSMRSGDGFKYLVAQMTQFDPKGSFVTGSWYGRALQRADEDYEMLPWNAGGNGIAPWCTTDQSGIGVPGCDSTGPAGWHFDAWSHPVDGPDANTADWAALWNLSWGFSAPFAPAISSEVHKCAYVYACPDCVPGETTYVSFSQLGLRDFFVAMEKHDPNGKSW